MADAKQDVNNGPPHSSRVVLAKPRLGGFGSSGFGASSSNKSSNAFGSVLRPPQLKPTSNPFLKVTEEKVEEKKNEEEKNTDDVEEKVKEDAAEAPKFMPLGSSNATPRSANPVPAPAQAATSSTGFVFGQNLSERVVMKENVNNGDADAEHSSSNGTSELLFTSAAASSVKENNQEESSSEGGGEGLAAAAAEYERSHARPPPATSNCTMTGEEGETNVLQISCRLFAWESGSWRERGRGVLRLNDAAGGDGARLVARVAGSLRVVLNTKLWPDMVVERAGTKSLRITAADAQQQVKLYLIMGAPADIAQLSRALSQRVAVSKKPDCRQHATSQAAAERLDSDYPDKAPADEDDVDNDVTDAPQQEKENDEKEDTKSLKRKEPVDDETSPKRQCPKILVE
ncbi:ran-binding protein 3 [Plutella xylostella]|uniref:ran-binding protein 3 n=1 Tax=Plutella xylostella TaxID=51655 RepID=UPI0020330E10|nr:ran-binding protein 3 [Plutella xylostella]